MNALPTYLDLLTSGEPQDGSLLEVRSKLPSGGMRQEFVPSRAHRAASGLIEARGREADTYVGVAPRSRQEGTRGAVERIHVLWADIDAPEAVDALERFAPAPSMVLGSGGSGRFHAYWSLRAPVAPDEAESGNKRLVAALGADPQAVDAARILRPPDTFNFKRARPVTLERLHVESYTVEQVVGHLADPEPERVSSVLDTSWSANDPLLAIPPPVYVELLTGQPIERDGKVACPFHDDRTPSLHVYDEPERGWSCFGCGRGGTIIDFGAALYGLSPRGWDYWAIRERLEADLGSGVAA